MAKSTIKAKELLAEIRAGLDDASLMKKYGFSAGGIHYSSLKFPLV